MEADRPLFIPVILGTARMGRMSLHAAQLVTGEMSKCAGVETDLIDIAKLPLPTNDAGEAIKHADFSAKMSKADALVVVSPEYNHDYSGLLKHVLDSCLKEYIHKAVGIVGVSAGPWGGTRGIQDLLPVMRELGLVTIFWDVNFATVQDAFDEAGSLRDQAYLARIDKFLQELVWMARTLRHGRAHVSVDQPGQGSTTAPAPPMPCPNCGAEMNHHADKLIVPTEPADTASADARLGGVVDEMHLCPACG